MTASSTPNVWNVACELLRTFVIAYLLTRLLPLHISDWKSALRLGLLL